MTEPVGEVDLRFSADDAAAVPWTEVSDQLATAEIFWLSTVRTGGRPHVTPLIAVWLDQAMWFCTGPGEQKAVNLAANPACCLTTGTDRIGDGLDIVVEGVAEQVSDEVQLIRLADEYRSKYGTDWAFDVRDGAFFGGGGSAFVFRVRPSTIFGFRKGDFSQNRWRFTR
jgi:hypothetical protein